NYQRDQFYSYSAALVQKGDIIRLKDVSLSYDFNLAQKQRFPFSSLQLYGYYLPNSLIWKANKMGIDPDFIDMKVASSLSLGVRASFR
ncbi:MAG TPA: hypothetical protein VGC22_10350, partial [Chitinophaga sp.]